MSQRKKPELVSTEQIISTTQSHQLINELSGRGYVCEFVGAKSPDPHQPKIDSFRKAQGVWEEVRHSYIGEYPQATKSVLTQWEYGFITGYSLGMSGAYPDFSAHQVFHRWVQGFEHRLPVLTGKFFKIGFRLGQRESGIAYVFTPEEETLTKYHAPFIIKNSSGDGWIYLTKILPSGAPKFSRYIRDAIKYENLIDVIRAEEKLSEYNLLNIRVASYIEEEKKCLKNS